MIRHKFGTGGAIQTDRQQIGMRDRGPERLGGLAEELMSTTLAGIDRPTVKLMLANLSIAKDNLRQAIARKPVPRLEKIYG